MTDIALFWNDAAWRADMALAGGDLATDDGLRTSVIVSLFTDAPAKADDLLPAGVDRGGWWGDALPDAPGQVTGSRLWLLKREKQLATVLDRAGGYAREALQWMLDGGTDAIAASVDAVATNPRSGVLALAITITRPGSDTPQRFDLLWDATA